MLKINVENWSYRKFENQAEREYKLAIEWKPSQICEFKHLTSLTADQLKDFAVHLRDVQEEIVRLLTINQEEQ